MDQLYWCYTNANTMDSLALRAAFCELYASLPELSEERFDVVFSAVCSLSAMQDELAFKAGAKVGFRLAAELLES